LLGKQLFYDAKDPRLARDGYLSCATCHNDGDQDGRVWDFTGLGEGLRNTISLRGRAGLAQGKLHWTGNFDEVQDFEGPIRKLAGGVGLLSDSDFTATQDPLGPPKAGLSADLDALAAYVSSLATVTPSPYRHADGSLSSSAQVGQSLFNSNCKQCHGGSSFTDSPSGLLHDVGTIKPSSGQRLFAPLTGLDTPTLRDAWNTAPYLHDGSALTLTAAVSAHTGIPLNATQLSQVNDYLLQISASEPAPTNLPPQVVLTSLADASKISLGTTINLSANAQDSDGSVVKVAFYSGNNLLATATTAPYTFSWNGAALGNYALTAKAYDNYGATLVSKAVNITIK